jgi:glutamate-5-semialdehyde dehydrogenase
LNNQLLEIVKNSFIASKKLAKLNSAKKDEILLAMADQLIHYKELVLNANKTDIENARSKQLPEAMIDRLLLTPERIDSMANAIKEVVELPDPVGKFSDQRIRPNGLNVKMMSIPLGVIAIIYEARPNVTSDAASLCIKSGNAVILRGGSEAFNSNIEIVKALRQGIESTNVDPAILSFIPTSDRDAMLELIKLDEYIDLVIPRGGEGLIRFVAENSRIPVIKHYKGVCHLFVDEAADQDTAINVLIDGKTSRPGVCNALETLLVHKNIASEFLPKAEAALNSKNVEIRGCSNTIKILSGIKPAVEDDYYAEYLSLIISVKIVDGIDEAVNHIEKYGSNHTEVIVTNDVETANKFIKEVNSSSVMVNASSRFADGGELGLGAEIGISTTKLHAYGPMGLDALTTKKFVVIGEGQTRHNIN